MPANSTYSFTAGQILTATDLNAVFAQTVAFAADSSNANTGTLPQARLPYRMDQNVRTTDNVQFNDGVFTGNLTISGTTTYVNTSVLDIKDKNIVLAKGSANGSQANTGGFTIDGANVIFQYDNSSNNMTLTHLLSIGNSTVNAVFGYNSSSLSGGQFIGNVNNYFQIIATNSNTGTSASGDYVVADDQGIGSTSYVDMGINSSNWSNTEWTINGPSDSYLYAHGGDLAIGTAENYQLQFFANGTLANNEAMRIDSGANVNIGNTKAGATSLTVGNNTVNVVINSSSFNINTVFTANSTVVNAVSYRVNTNFVANATGVYHTGTVNANSFTTTSVTVNTTAVSVGSNVAVNTSVFFVGNSTVYSNVYAGAISLSSNSTNTSTINSTSFTGTANNASYLANVAAAIYVQNTDSRTLSGNLNFSAANVYFNNGLFVGANSSVNTTSHFVGNSTVNTNVTAGQISISGQTVNSSVYTGLSYTANNSSYLGGSAAANYVQNNDSRVLSGNLNFTAANVYYNAGLFVGANVVVNTSSQFVGNSTVNTNVTAGQISLSGQTINSTAYTGLSYTANNSSYLGGTAAASFVQNTDSRTLSGNLNFSGANVNFSSGLFTGANLAVNTSAILIGNSTVNTVATAGQVQFSGGATVNGTIYTGIAYTANNATNLGGTPAANFVANTNSGLVANSSGTFINPNTGIVANASGLFVNAAYINTISANNSAYLGGTAAANYLTNNGSYTISGVYTHGANVVFSNGSVLIANGSFGTNTQVLISNGTSMYWGMFSANDALSLGGTNAAFYVVNTDSRTLSGNLVFSGANVTFTGGVRIANGVSLIANNAMGTNGQVLTSNGTSLYWQTLAGVNAAAAYTWTGIHTHSANVIYSNGSVIQANAGFGTTGQVLTSNGTSMYWSNPVTIYYANGSQAYP